MKFNEIQTVETLLKEYGMSPGPATPSGGGTVEGTQQEKVPTTVAAKDLKKNSKIVVPSKKNPSQMVPAEVVSTTGEKTLAKNDNEDVVIVKDPKTGETTAFDPDATIALTASKETPLDDLMSRKKQNVVRQIVRKQNKLKQLIRAQKFNKQGDPIFEINFNSAEVVKSALDAPIRCGFEAETVWPILADGGDDDDTSWLDDLDWGSVSDLIYGQEGRRSVERVEQAYREWLQESDYFYELESEVIDELVNDRKEDEAYIDDFINDYNFEDEIKQYKAEKLADLYPASIDGDEKAQEEFEEYSNWDDDAWAREYVEQNKEDEYVEWLEQHIRDNAEQLDDAWQRALDQYDIEEWVRIEYSGSWFSALSDQDIYMYNDQGAVGVTEVASMIEDWASNDGSMTNDVRAGSYHSGKGVDNTYWRVEDDSSIEGDGAKAEIISPVYDSPRQMLIEMKSLFDYLEENDVVTNSSTGLHITMSIAGEKMDMNRLKLALLLGDQYVLTQFGRQFNSYTKSRQENIEQQAKRAVQDPKGKNINLDELEGVLSRGIDPGKFSSINFKHVRNEDGNYLTEFRIAGGDDYHTAYDKIAKAVVRYGATLQAAYDSNAFRKDYLKAIVKTIETAKDGVTKTEIEKLPGKQIPDTAFAQAVAALMFPEMKLDALENIARIEQALSGGPAHDPQEAKRSFLWIMKNMLIGFASGKSNPSQTIQIVRAIRAEQKRHGVDNKEIMLAVYRQYKDLRNSLSVPMEELVQKAAAGLNAITMKPAESPQFKKVIRYSPSADQAVLIPKNKFNALQDGKPVEIGTEDFKIVSMQDLGHVLRAKIGNMPEHYPEPEKWVAQFKQKYGVDPGVPGAAKPSEWIQPGPSAIRMLSDLGYELIKESATVFDRFDKLPLHEQLKLLSKIDKRKIDEAWNKKYKSSIEEGVISFDEVHRWRVTFNNGKSKVVRAKNSRKAKDIAPPSADWRIIGIKKIEDLGPASDAKRIKEGAVPETNFADEYKQIMSKPLLGSDLKGQMYAYQLIPDPQMIKAFREQIATGGRDVDLRPIVKSFAQSMLHPSQQKTAGLTESRIQEAKGIMGRVAGDKFVNGENQLEFQGVTVYPQDYEQFEDPEQRDVAIAEFEKQVGGQIQWTNTPNRASLAFGIATLTDPLNNDTPIYWGRYFKKKSVDMMGSWANNQAPSGWKLRKAGALKLDIGIDPQHLIKSEALHQGLPDVQKTVAANSQGHEMQSELVGALEQIEAKQNPIFENAIQHLPALRDYFGEIMGPCALMAGMVGGQAEEANKDLLKGVGWDNCSVFWPQSMNYALVDSVFIGPDGQEVGISSKGGKGARASAKNIVDAINKAPEKLVNAHKITVDIISIVDSNTAADAPFRLAEYLGILPNKLEAEIKQYIEAGKTDYSKLSEDAQELFNHGTPKQSAPGFNTGYALLALLAKKVAKIVNQQNDFSNGAIAFLNQSSIVQLYCKMGKQGNNARVTGWDAIYPPNFQGKVVLDGSKNYYSSRIAGKFAFGFV